MVEVVGADPTRPRGAAKSPTAFRTISEVSTDLDIPQHVLRFWETKFPQIRPLKRGGGRRYYRPDDVELLRRIQSLLYKEGYTIKGVQRVLRESRNAAAAPAATSRRVDSVSLGAPGPATVRFGLFDAGAIADPEEAIELGDESDEQVSDDTDLSDEELTNLDGDAGFADPGELTEATDSIPNLTTFDDLAPLTGSVDAAEPIVVQDQSVSLSVASAEPPPLTQSMSLSMRTELHQILDELCALRAMLDQEKQELFG